MLSFYRRRRSHSSLRRLAASRRSIASLEFAIILPLMLLLLAGVYDISEALILYTEVFDTAHAIPASASIVAVQGNGSTTLTYGEIQLLESFVWADMPELRSGYKTSASTAVTMTSVAFEPNTTNCANDPSAGVYLSSPYYYNSTRCTYDAIVVWSVAYNAAAGTANSTVQQYVRPCVGLSADDYGLHQVASSTNIPNALSTASSPPNTADTFLDELPTLSASSASSSSYSTTGTANIGGSSSSVTLGTTLESGPSPILAVDVEFTYKPTFGIYFNGNLNFWATGLWPVRSVESENPSYSPSVTLTTSNSTPVTAFEPLTQQFTTIAGTDKVGSTTVVTTNPSGLVALYYSPLVAAAYDPPAEHANSATYGAYATSWCVNTEYSFPNGSSPLSVPPTNEEL